MDICTFLKDNGTRNIGPSFTIQKWQVHMANHEHAARLHKGHIVSTIRQKGNTLI